MESIWSSLLENYDDDFETNLFNEECELYVKLIAVLKLKTTSESFISGEESSCLEDSESKFDEIGFGNNINENDPQYTYALQKAFLDNFKKDNLYNLYDDDNDSSEDVTVQEESSIYVSILNLSEESERMLARLYPAFTDMIKRIMFDHYNVNRIGRVRSAWFRHTPEYVMLESATEWKSIYPIMNDQTLFFTINLPMISLYIQCKYPDRSKIMFPRIIVTKRAKTLNIFLSQLFLHKDIERFQVLAAMKRTIDKGHIKSFSTPIGLLENLMSCVKRVDYTAIQRMAVGILTKFLRLPRIVTKIMREKNLDIIYMLFDIICGRLRICDRTSKERVAHLLASITKLYHLEFAIFLIENIDMKGLFGALSGTLRHRIPLSVMRVFTNILCHPLAYDMVTALPDFEFEPVLHYFRNTRSKVRLGAYRLLERILRVSRLPEWNNNHKYFITEGGAEILSEFLQDVVSV